MEKLKTVWDLICELEELDPTLPVVIHDRENGYEYIIGASVVENVGVEIPTENHGYCKLILEKVVEIS